jgi:hypothetical protein
MRRMYVMIKAVITAAFLLPVIFLAGCAGSSDITRNNIGGAESLALSEEEEFLVLENEKIAVRFNKKNGSIFQLANKEKNLYLVKESPKAAPFTAAYKTHEETEFTSFNWKKTEDTENKKALQFSWKLKDGASVYATAELSKNSGEIRFFVRLDNNPPDPIIKISYPVLTNIRSLDKGENDYFLSPWATGYLINNPARYFSASPGGFRGFTEEEGLYPNGWFYPMQFMAWFSKGLGGFYIATEDPDYTVKNFTFSGGPALDSSVIHHVDDIAAKTADFKYPVVIANLTRGDWYEAADRYRNWAEKQPWTAKGKVEQRQDVSRWLYEETSLVNFGIDGTSGSPSLTNIYKKIKQDSGGRILNIYGVQWFNSGNGFFNSNMESFFPAKIRTDFTSLIRNGGDKVVLFGFNTLFNSRYTGSDANEWKSMAIRNVKNQPLIFSWENNSWLAWYMDPSEKAWFDFTHERESILLKEYNADGLYHDVGICALAPVECYDSSHSHGSRTNLIPYYISLQKDARDQTVENNTPLVGQELISEPFIPYVDLYQARANGGLLSFLEHDRIKSLITRGAAAKVPLFDYVYHEYGPVRMDGFMLPTEETGEAYYSIMALTALWGGIPEFDFEFINVRTGDIVPEKTAFVGELARARLGYGKDYLTYGRMERPVEPDAGKVKYRYQNSNVVNGMAVLRGTTSVDSVITSAYTHEGKAGLFFVNVTREPVNAAFRINGDWYGKTEGAVYLASGDGEKLGDLENGIREITIELPPRRVVMLELR